ncbi:MAG: MFS transporter [Gemmataceae bacterium]
MVQFKLSFMMFLQFFIWGAWFPLVFGYLPSLGFSGSEQAMILNCFPIAALVGLFFSNQFADRNFAAERFLALSHFIGGLCMLGLFFVRRLDEQTPAPFWLFFGLMLVHCLFYVPTISITNSIAFANLKDPATGFGPVRLWGTIGWIAASLPFVFILVDWQKVPSFADAGFVNWIGSALNPDNALKGDDYRRATALTFAVSGSASLLLAAFSLLLPHTPPKPAGESGENLAWLGAVKLLGYPFILVLFIVTFIDATIHQMYFVWTERYLTSKANALDGINTGVGIASNWAMPIMSVGQIAEIGTMAILGYVLHSLGWRTTMIIGILGHAVRFSVFAFAPLVWIAISANLLHGVCYAFFFATVYIFVDEYFPKDIRASAQGLFNALILGLGPMAGNTIGPMLGEMYNVGGTDKEPILNFQQIFVVPTAMALVAALLLLVAFWPPKRQQAESRAIPAPAH